MKKIFLMAALTANNVIISAQNVGIGTPSPTEQLHTTKGVRFESLKGVGTRLIHADSTGKLLTKVQNSGLNSTSGVIPDGPSCTGLTRGIALSGLPAIIESVSISVKVNIAHTFDSDLRVYLIAPNGSVLNLIFDNGGTNDNFTNTVFNDAASGTLQTGTPPFTGNYRPTANLNAYCGITPTVSTFSAIGGGIINPNGLWTLQVFDKAPNDVGIFANWSITLGDGGFDNFLTKWANGSLSAYSNVYDNGNNIGIGTTSPANKLSVNGSVDFTGNVGIGISFPANKLSVNGSADFTGNVGIGITAPVNKLSVVGNANFTGNVGIGTSLPASVLHLQSPDGVDIPRSDIVLSRFWAHENDTRASAIFHYFNSATSNDNLAFAVSGNGGNVDQPNKFSQIKMMIQANGNVGIGTTSPLYKLDVAGLINTQGYRCRQGTSGSPGINAFNIDWTGSATQLWIDVTNLGSISLTSDRRLKDKIIPCGNNALERVMALNPVGFNYKKIEGTIFTGSLLPQEGFIADELQEIIPSAVNGEKNGLTKNGTIQPQTVNMGPVLAVLTKAIQEQQQIIEAQNKKLETLMQEMHLIKEKIK